METRSVVGLNDQSNKTNNVSRKNGKRARKSAIKNTSKVSDVNADFNKEICDVKQNKRVRVNSFKKVTDQLINSNFFNEDVIVTDLWVQNNEVVNKNSSTSKPELFIPSAISYNPITSERDALIKKVKNQNQKIIYSLGPMNKKGYSGNNYEHEVDLGTSDDDTLEEQNLNTIPEPKVKVKTVYKTKSQRRKEEERRSRINSLQAKEKERKISSQIKNLSEIMGEIVQKAKVEKLKDVLNKKSSRKHGEKSDYPKTVSKILTVPLKARNLEKLSSAQPFASGTIDEFLGKMVSKGFVGKSVSNKLKLLRSKRAKKQVANRKKLVEIYSYKHFDDSKVAL